MNKEKGMYEIGWYLCDVLDKVKPFVDWSDGNEEVFKSSPSDNLDAPANNDDQLRCWWCDGELIVLDTGFFGRELKVCSKCGK